MLLAAERAASGRNLQPISFIVVRDPAARARLGELCDQSFIGTTSVNPVFCMDLRRNRRLADAALAPYAEQRSFRYFRMCIQNVMLAVRNACVVADALVLGTLSIGNILELINEASEMLSLHYSADAMSTGNADFIETIRMRITACAGAGHFP